MSTDHNRAYRTSDNRRLDGSCLYCKDPECPDNKTAHGPVVWAHGRQAYTHLALMAAGSHEDLRLHMAQDHGLMTCGGEDSYGRNVERHAHHHGVRIECYAY